MAGTPLTRCPKASQSVRDTARIGLMAFLESTLYGAQVDVNAWRFYWHRLIDHLEDGKDAESFFAAL
jgi:hypothetical protein